MAALSAFIRRGAVAAFALLPALFLARPCAAAAATPSPCGGFGVQPITLTWTLPTTFVPGLAQQGADCMAWQSFIALNWAADPNDPGQPDQNALASAFGAPGVTTPTVWESYWDASRVFEKPVGSSLLWRSARPALKTLVRRSEQGPADLSLSGIGQAGDGKWLTNQRGGLTFYEILMNEDEFDFDTLNVFNGDDLTTYAGQSACAMEYPTTTTQGGFVLPGGAGTQPTLAVDRDCSGALTIYGRNVGAIEIKAAWTVLPADHSLDYRYLTAVANIQGPTGPVVTATVGLVGLHIIHKVQGAAQFLWATFEQIDNSPDEGGQNGYTPPALPPNPNRQPSPGYSYFNPNCNAATDVYQCVHNQLPGTPCAPGQSPPGCDPYDAPMQVTRIVSVDSIANGTTQFAWSLMPAASVFNYYRLINVQWPSLPQPLPPQIPPLSPMYTPLPRGDITPTDLTGRVANTTLETFQQTSNSCMDCHQGAPIAKASQTRLFAKQGRVERVVAPVGLLSKGNNYASDYSFIFVVETLH